MKTVKLMVVNAARERERHLIGCVFDAVEATSGTNSLRRN